MPTRRKFRRNKRKTRRRGKKGGMPGNFQHAWFPTTLCPTDCGDGAYKGGNEYEGICKWLRQGDNREALNEDTGYALNDEFVALYYLNKALTQVKGLSITTSSMMTPFLKRAKDASQTPEGKEMEIIVFNLMKEFIEAYNNKKNIEYKIAKIQSMNEDNKDKSPDFNFEFFPKFVGSNPSTNADGKLVDPNGGIWEGQNAYLTAGDTEHMHRAERAAWRLKGKQTRGGFFIGKTLGYIGKWIWEQDEFSEIYKKGYQSKLGYGLNGMTGLQNCAVLLCVCINLYSEGVSVNGLDTIAKIKTEVNKAINKPLPKKFKDDAEKNEVKKLYKQIIKVFVEHYNSGKASYSACCRPRISYKKLGDVVVAMDAGHRVKTGIEYKIEEKAAAGGRKRRRRKRRTRRGGKSRRKRRTRRRRRR